MSLDEFTDNELQMELDRRKNMRENLPLELKKPDYSALHKSVVAYLEALAENGLEDNDTEHYIFETAVEAVYGEGVWDFVNSII